MSAPKTSEPKGMSCSPEPTLAKKGKRGATRKVSLKLTRTKMMEENTHTLVVGDAPYTTNHRLEVKGPNGQVVKMDGPFTAITMINNTGPKKDRVSITISDTGTNLVVYAEKPE